MMEPLGEKEERVLKEFEFDLGKLVGELGQDFEGLGALLDAIRRMGAEIYRNELESLKEKMAKTSEEIKSKLDEREENNKVLKKKITAESKKTSLFEGKVEKMKLLYDEATMIQRETDIRCQHKITEMVALMEKHKNEYDKMVEEKDAELKVYKIRQQKQLSSERALIKSICFISLGGSILLFFTFPDNGESLNSSFGVLVSVTVIFIQIWNHPEWQRDCGMRSPSDPLVLALEKDNKATKGKPKRCCSTCLINQRCTHPDKVYQAEALEQETEDILKPPPRRQERRRVVGDANSELSLTPTSPTSSLASSSFGRTAIEVGVSAPTPKPWDPPTFYPPLPSSDSEWDEPEPLPPGPKIPSQGPIASRTQKQTREVIQAPLRQAITSDGETKLIKVPFSSIDLEIGERIAKGYRSDPIGVAKTMKFMIKQHSPDWADLQLLLDALTETEKQLVLKVAGDLAEDDCRTTQEDVKAVFPLQDPGWDPNDDEGLGRLKRYQELIVKGLERAIPKTINWSALYAIKQGPSQTPSEFLDHLRDAMRRHTTLDPGSDEGTQQLINLFLGQSTGDIRRKLQQIRGPNSWNLETLLDEAWRVFSNREEGYKQGMKKVVAVVKEGEKGRHGQGPPKQGPP
ncbi:hypothetical protein DUI87_34448 [Hirundo rustica rustica]|uniref:Core shell protein Gag P30 domain-containing protein n=1 Tax=Hirundo rustica rustica TaxID=333673 RepID=A0A3M0J3Q2_HIRRU|nr:hypothetical protein DUI87_34448 [Hirundo rustica rustica]